MKDLRDYYEPDGEPVEYTDNWEVGRVYADRDVGTYDAILWRRCADGGFERVCYVTSEWWYPICRTPRYGPFTPMRLKAGLGHPRLVPGDPLVTIPLDGTPFYANDELWKYSEGWALFQPDLNKWHYARYTLHLKPGLSLRAAITCSVKPKTGARLLVWLVLHPEVQVCRSDGRRDCLKWSSTEGLCWKYLEDKRWSAYLPVLPRYQYIPVAGDWDDYPEVEE